MADFIGGDSPASLPGQQANPVAASGGDMTKTVYDSNNDGKVNAADHADNAGHADTATVATDIANMSAAGINHYYGTDESGATGKWPLPSITQVTIENKGVGLRLFDSITGQHIAYRSLLAGANMTITLLPDGTLELAAASGGGGGGGIPEAPSDDKVYGRMNAGWVEVASGGDTNFDAILTAVNQVTFEATVLIDSDGSVMKE